LVIHPRDRAEIAHSLRSLRSGNRFVSLILGASVGVIVGTAAVDHGAPRFVWVPAAVLGAWAGWLVERWWWALWIRWMESCYVKVDGEFIEIRGLVKGLVRTKRFSLWDVAALECGTQRDPSTLVVQQNNGKRVDFLLMRVIFSEESLTRMAEHIVALCPTLPTKP